MAVARLPILEHSEQLGMGPGPGPSTGAGSAGAAGGGSGGDGGGGGRSGGGGGGGGGLPTKLVLNINDVVACLLELNHSGEGCGPGPCLDLEFWNLGI